MLYFKEELKKLFNNFRDSILFKKCIKCTENLQLYKDTRVYCSKNNKAQGFNFLKI